MTGNHHHAVGLLVILLIGLAAGPSLAASFNDMLGWLHNQIISLVAALH